MALWVIYITAAGIILVVLFGFPRENELTAEEYRDQLRRWQEMLDRLRRKKDDSDDDSAARTGTH